jgi:hypothetical protein
MEIDCQTFKRRPKPSALICRDYMRAHTAKG